MTLTWTPNATQELVEIYESIVHEHSSTALKQTQRVIHAAEHLLDFPYLGREGRVHGSRELVISGTPYILAYGVHAQSVVIFAVRHGARLWPEKFSTPS